jgi:holo-[acyl-carrier protein] synthase
MLGCGIDLVEVQRVRRAIERHGERFIQRVFTEEETNYCTAKAHPWPHWAVRFAAKEALFKSLAPGMLHALVWHEIGVARGTSGAPTIELFARTRERLNGWRFAIALSHERDLAIAQVLSFPPEG